MTVLGHFFCLIPWFCLTFFISERSSPTTRRPQTLPIQYNFADNTFDMNKLSVFLLLLSSILIACTPQQPDQSEQRVQEASLNSDSSMENADPGPFANTVQGLDKYWYQGLGELNTYRLEQNRYQGVHPGQALLIFVSEDFLTDKQVKNDQYKNENSTKVLKTNAITRFTTGIYDYSIMSSVFTPVYTKDYPRTIKLSHTSQDWCGQTYAQVNLQDNGSYAQQLHSYFENEADRSTTKAADALEDELLNRIRMSYRDLPTGELQLIPSMSFLRLRHKPFEPIAANASLGDYEGTEFTGSNLKVYTIEYPSLQRTVQYVFSATAPYYIEGWVDAYPSAFDGVVRATKAFRQETVLEAYWQQNSNEQSYLKKRQDMGWQ